MSMRILLVFLITFLSGFRTDDKLKAVCELMEKLSKANAQKQNIAYDLTYNLYADESEQKLISTLKGMLIQYKGEKYSQMGEIESLKTQKYFISIDREDKILMLSDNNGKETEVFNLDQLKKYLLLCKQYKIIKLNNKQSQLRMELKAGDISKMDIFYHSTNFLVEKICMVYNTEINTDHSNELEDTNKKLEILYKEKENIMPGDSRLKLASYCSMKNGLWKTSPRYAKYEFINNLNKK